MRFGADTIIDGAVLDKKKTKKEVLKMMNGLKKTLCSVLAAITISAVGCRSRLTEGEIYNKIYEPSRHYTWIEQKSSLRNYGKIALRYYECELRNGFDDEDFIIQIRKPIGNKGKYRTQNYYVDKENYNRLKIGDYFRLFPTQDMDAMDRK